MRNRFQSARIRIRWAKEDLDQLKRRVRTFFKSNPYSVFADPEADGVYELHKVRLIKAIPDSFNKHTVGALESLRAALDLAAAALAPDPVKGDTHFPFCKSASDMKGRLGS